MIQFGDQTALLVLSLSALSNVDIDANHATSAPAPIIDNKGPCFDPPRLATRPDNAKLADKLMLPFFECVPTLSAQPRQVVWMNKRAPLVPRDLGDVLRQAENCRTCLGQLHGP